MLIFIEKAVDSRKSDNLRLTLSEKKEAMPGANLHGFQLQDMVYKLTCFPRNSWKTYIIIVTLPAGRVSVFHDFPAGQKIDIA